MSEWEPIETAPKDGTRILIWLPDSENVLSVYYDHRFAWVGDEDGTRQWWEGAWTDDAVTADACKSTNYVRILAIVLVIVLIIYLSGGEVENPL